ncbi:helix-turn-helix transcriptional regulator [Paenibacillus aurantius]|uniref:Helix-turn-helix transcriptional regulator n=1 Tax=Paenibacillus aurantius TaxID=2918900 RepID=A0AA96RF63_9BACL|nr:helix-turn-helix transcriptional regulator [Paenibacillus aurantius]WJH35652.1 helix-turn-helix transcriptional regulator [Paenibacillus sp. CC-CFT747]WNQ10933.1 helix-turn-helix transcriptional regulator [Paenibacillus aurantius]
MRKLRGLTQQQLAERVHINALSVYRAENGKNISPRTYCLLMAWMDDPDQPAAT